MDVLMDVLMDVVDVFGIWVDVVDVFILFWRFLYFIPFLIRNPHMTAN